MSKGVADEPEIGGGLMVAAIQLAIMLGRAFGGFLLDRISIAATLVGGTLLLVAASFSVGNGDRIKPRCVFGRNWTPVSPHTGDARRVDCAAGGAPGDPFA